MMIALLSYSTSWSRDNATISPTGEVVNPDDSVMISIDDLRTANAKMIELEYEKAINTALRQHIDNDSNTIYLLTNQLRDADRRCKASIKKVKTERNVAGGIGVGAIILLILSLL